MRKIFRNLACSEARFLKQLDKNHNKFFQTILQNRRQLYFGKLMEEAATGGSSSNDNFGKSAGMSGDNSPRTRLIKATNKLRSSSTITSPNSADEENSK
jgi:hypothetical protein